LGAILAQKLNISFQSDFLTPLGSRPYRFEQKKCPNPLCAGLAGGQWLDNTTSHEGLAVGVVVARKHARRRRKWDVENFQASRSFRLYFWTIFPVKIKIPIKYQK
jgi:hypothetical protein